MADFALFATACERGANEPARFLAAYAANRSQAYEQALEASPVAAALLKVLGDEHEWEGTATELLQQINNFAPPQLPRDWPRKPNVLTNHLKRLASELRRARGLEVNCDGRRRDYNRSRLIRITRLPDDTPETPSRTVQDDLDDPELVPLPPTAGPKRPGKSAGATMSSGP